MACLAEYEGAVPVLFQTRVKSRRGKYYIWLFDDSKNSWRRLVIDDYIPCDGSDNSPIFSKPKNNEIWVMLLEKAFAKMWQSYAELKGGQTAWALRAMTGDNVQQYIRRGMCWGRFNVPPRKAENANPEFQDDAVEDDELLSRVENYLSIGSVVCASIQQDDGDISRDCKSLGLITNHAYSILKVSAASVLPGPMVELRNPWGRDARGGWRGDWGLGSNLWDEQTGARQALGWRDSDMEDEDYGSTFWMLWTDFAAFFDNLTILDRSVDIHTLVLDVKADQRCSATEACVRGCCKFWLCCRGCARLYLPHRSSREPIHRRWGVSPKVVYAVWTVVLIVLLLAAIWLMFVRSAHSHVPGCNAPCNYDGTSYSCESRIRYLKEHGSTEANAVATVNDQCKGQCECQSILVTTEKDDASALAGGHGIDGFQSFHGHIQSRSRDPWLLA
eukprot:TRINITY_DN31310_c0_g1_i1.p1 TRINITY_DN31310_c0_g1~~TRINITY_DN31310_c0_g1_i1.p1  ORF type:complete len:478 (+),score=60.67 TRINITY_DN31310_c0_g1_i1:101-1435(+)